MMKRVISFEEFPSPHTGGALFKMLTKVLTNFNLEDKVMSITLDNASNNTSAMDKLKLKYDPPMGGRFYHSRCVAHIINLVVQAGLGVPAIDAIIESFKTMLKDIFKSSARTRQRYVKICKDAEKPCLRPNWDVPTRWNSTYHMFLSGLKQQTTLAYYHDVLANKNRCNHFSAESWVIIQSLTQLLEVFNNATKILSGVYYPTSPLVLQQIFFMSTALSEYELEGGILSSMIKPMKKKLRKYFQHMPSIITCAAALNPCFNVNGVDYLIESISRDLEFFDDTFASKSKSYFNESLEGLYNLYYAKYGNPTQSSQTSGGATSSKVSGENKRYERYVNSDFVTHSTQKTCKFLCLRFLKEKETIFPFYPHGMDIISVQASSVASESAFSTSGRVLSIRRTRLTPASLEMCMCLKDHLDAKERKQDKCPLETPLDFEEGVFDDEVQQNEAIPLSDEEIALDASSEGTMSPGGPRYDYMVSSEEAEDEY
ncbi:zinc finger BED domain-containing protein RICESLEEPER 2 [Tanacetum coccineum]